MAHDNTEGNVGLSTTITIQFNDKTADTQVGSMLKAEIDGRDVADGGLNVDGTSFTAGDQPVYLMYKTPDVRIVEHLNTLSSPSGARIDGVGTMQKEDYVVFANSSEGSLSYPVLRGMSYSWVGIDGGTLVMNDLGTRLTTASGDHTLGIARVTYTAGYTSHRITNTPESLGGETEYQVLTIIVGETTL